NASACRAFWEKVGPTIEPPLSREATEKAIARAQGNLLYCVTLQDCLRGMSTDEHRIARIIVPGAEVLMRALWDRLKGTAAATSGLGVLCAAREALPLDAIAEVAGWTDADRNTFHSHTAEWLHATAAPSGPRTVYRLRHEWMSEFVREKI